jgi:hypothetical protein
MPRLRNSKTGVVVNVRDGKLVNTDYEPYEGEQADEKPARRARRSNTEDTSSDSE